MFKTGDRVRYVLNDPHSYKSFTLFDEVGEIKTVTVYPSSRNYGVQFDGHAGISNCTEDELALVENEVLPKGTFQTLLDEITNPGVKQLPDCDCGTNKTYGILPAEYHSDWCKLLQQKESV